MLLLSADTHCDRYTSYPHGILKQHSCLSRKAASTVDLYVLESTPQVGLFSVFVFLFVIVSSVSQIVISTTLRCNNEDRQGKGETLAHDRHSPLWVNSHHRHRHHPPSGLYHSKHSTAIQVRKLSRYPLGDIIASQ